MKRRGVPSRSRMPSQDREFENLLRIAAARAAKMKAVPQRQAGEPKGRAASM